MQIGQQRIVGRNVHRGGTVVIDAAGCDGSVTSLATTGADLNFCQNVAKRNVIESFSCPQDSRRASRERYGWRYGLRSQTAMPCTSG
ncbi:MAG: hypothetical protein WBO46_00765, partial [Caldilineaceae bacterium]